MENALKQAIIFNSLNSSETLMDYENFLGLKESGGYPNLHLIGLKNPMEHLLAGI